MEGNRGAEGKLILPVRVAHGEDERTSTPVITTLTAAPPRPTVSPDYHSCQTHPESPP
jgi:hypothetical protein